MVGRAIERNWDAADAALSRHSGVHRIPHPERRRHFAPDGTRGLWSVRQQHLHHCDDHRARDRAAVHRHGRDPVPLRSDGSGFRLARSTDRPHPRPSVRSVHPTIRHSWRPVGRCHGGRRIARTLTPARDAAARLQRAAIGGGDPCRSVSGPDHSAERARHPDRDAGRDFHRIAPDCRHYSRPDADVPVPGLRALPRVAEPVTGA